MPCQPSPRCCPAILPAALVLALGFVAAVSGCAAGGSYPSLASRPAERLPEAAPADSPPPMHPAANARGTPSAELAARLESLVSQAQSAHRDFASQRASAAKAVGNEAAPIGSEAWARATQALSGMEAARSLTAQPLADLDRLDVDDRLAHPAGGDATQRPDAQAIAQARDTVADLIAQEDAVLAKLDRKVE